jgi:DnaJ-class molecular chaperone
VEGNDLIHEVTLGRGGRRSARNRVPTLRKKSRGFPRAQSGRRFRLRDRGLPTATGARGNLYVIPQIAIRKELTEAERKLWQILAAFPRA